MLDIWDFPEGRMMAKVKPELKVMEGSRAVAEAVKACRPDVICAYPITPQTHIVAELANIVANGELKTEYVNADSEFSAASIGLGASAAGARAFTSSSSQGILLMNEVLYNIAGMRLPVVLSCANRAISAPLNIWNDHQDSFSVRDSGWIQLYAESNQEAADMHIQAFKIAEDHRVLLPVMVCMDGFLITHTYEPVEVFNQDEVDRFLPPYDPPYVLDPKKPLTFGSFAEPDKYMETRYILHHTLEKAQEVVEEVARDFGETFSRFQGGLIDTYATEDASIIIVAMGSVLATMKEAVDKMRNEGKKVGILKVRTFRPFPKEAIYEALKGAEKVAVVEKAISLGYGGILGPEMRSVFYGKKKMPQISSFIAGLGGREITTDTIFKIVEKTEEKSPELEFVDLRREIL